MLVLGGVEGRRGDFFHFVFWLGCWTPRMHWYGRNTRLPIQRHFIRTQCVSQTFREVDECTSGVLAWERIDDIGLVRHRLKNILGAVGYFFLPDKCDDPLKSSLVDLLTLVGGGANLACAVNLLLHTDRKDTRTLELTRHNDSVRRIPRRDGIATALPDDSIEILLRKTAVRTQLPFGEHCDNRISLHHTTHHERRVPITSHRNAVCKHLTRCVHRRRSDYHLRKCYVRYQCAYAHQKLPKVHDNSPLL